ncbi:MAG: DNA-binding transcriptional LysR family regulator [Candidatus Azotimanducaceae bacterium]|jgi:DNA-binding transcriptional LysR family regulator
MPLSWEDAQTFLAVSEHGSFSAAAKILGLGQPTISRRIQNLEKALKQQLFIRGKHGALPTEEAAKLIPAAEQMARWATEFDRVSLGVEQAVSGIVKIAAPPGIAVEQLAPFAAYLKITAPHIKLEILASIEHIDLTRGGADLAIRTHLPTEPELIALFSGRSKPVIYASREYAETIKQPCTWADLDWVSWAKPYKHVSPRPILEKLIPDFEPIFASDDYLVQKAAVREGLGVMVMGTLSDQQLRESNLVEIDIGVEFPDSEFFIVCAKSMQQVPRVVTVSNALIKSYTSGKNLQNSGNLEA